jgi:hypothetical protein
MLRISLDKTGQARFARVPNLVVVEGRSFVPRERRRGEAAPWSRATSKKNLAPAAGLCRAAHKP